MLKTCAFVNLIPIDSIRIFTWLYSFTNEEIVKYIGYDVTMLKTCAFVNLIPVDSMRIFA